MKQNNLKEIIINKILNNNFDKCNLRRKKIIWQIFYNKRNIPIKEDIFIILKNLEKNLNNKNEIITLLENLKYYNDKNELYIVKNLYFKLIVNVLINFSNNNKILIIVIELLNKIFEYLNFFEKYIIFKEIINYKIENLQNIENFIDFVQESINNKNYYGLHLLINYIRNYGEQNIINYLYKNNNNFIIILLNSLKFKNNQNFIYSVWSLIFNIINLDKKIDNLNFIKILLKYNFFEIFIINLKINNSNNLILSISIKTVNNILKNILSNRNYYINEINILNNIKCFDIYKILNYKDVLLCIKLKEIIIIFNNLINQL